MMISFPNLALKSLAPEQPHNYTTTQLHIHRCQSRCLCASHTIIAHSVLYPCLHEQPTCPRQEGDRETQSQLSQQRRSHSVLRARRPYFPAKVVPNKRGRKPRALVVVAPVEEDSQMLTSDLSQSPAPGLASVMTDIPDTPLADITHGTLNEQTPLLATPHVNT